jgi:hypothetical protein
MPRLAAQAASGNFAAAMVSEVAVVHDARESSHRNTCALIEKSELHSGFSVAPKNPDRRVTVLCRIPGFPDGDRLTSCTATKGRAR